MELEFDHVGMITDQKKDDENWVEQTRVWVTSPRKHPYNIEWLRYEPDTPVTGPLRTQPHVAFKVKDLEPHIKGQNVILGPMQVADFLKIAFIQTPDGAVVEFMQYLKEGWFDDEKSE